MSQQRASPLPPKGLRQRCAGPPTPADKYITASCRLRLSGLSSAPCDAALEDNVRPRSRRAGFDSAATLCAAAADPLVLEAAPELSEGGRSHAGPVTDVGPPHASGALRRNGSHRQPAWPAAAMCGDRGHPCVPLPTHVCLVG
ncbi:PREDICTED: 39S ribosomal protein L55, mitochondrial isoform X2 [Hipposideros armiger]|uniref:39S ribosomal protein L55, mitochondrial isoform X2 n=1 Tax=Hipposideros armiger TaxID=186990 RepID=A0A8B7QN27_HIPAR|nr:PREDICTED: 39S ribosomal protein L55, mitochondrial isoform X2 [Hipposideros armiger]